MSLKIESLNFVKEGTVATRKARSGQMGPIVAQIVSNLARLTNGNEMSVKIAGAGKYLRYALQKQLQKSSGNANIYVSRSVEHADVFVVGIGDAPRERPGTGKTAARK